MRRTIAAGAGGAALVVAVAVAVGARTGDVTQEQSLRLDTPAGEGVERMIDVGKEGVTPGDLTLFRFPLLDDQGAEMGRVRGICTVVARPRGRPAAWLDDCRLTLQLPVGQIMTQGLLRPRASRASLHAITGGTGDYRNARGQVRIRPRGEGTLSFTVNIIP